MDRVRWQYRAANHSELEHIWQKNVDAHPGDERWSDWRDAAILGHSLGRMQTFCVFADDEPVGEGTLLFSPDCAQIGGRLNLADGASIANINGLRIEKAFEGLGHISKLVRTMEMFILSSGYSSLTIGVEEKERRNLAIYRHWGYDQLIFRTLEDGEYVLYLKKDLRDPDQE